MASGLQVWSQTAASNNTADSAVNWQEGQAPSSVNDSARGMMASAAKWRDDNNGTLATTGSTTAFTVTSNQVEAALTDGYTIAVLLHATADSSATLAVDGLSAKPMQLIAGTNLAGGELLANTIHRFTYSSGSTAWIRHGHEALGSIANAINTTNLTDNAVTYRKLQSETDNTILGNVQGASFPAQEIAIGAGLVLSTTSTSTSQGAFTSTSTSTAIPFTLKAAFPPPAVYKNLAIKVASNTTVSASADFLTVASTASNYQTVAASGTINFGTTGANALDSGSIASGTWYAIWAIAKQDGTQAWLASTSFTSPTMPSGYTFKARYGAVVTSTSTSGQNLMGTWQYGKTAQYVVGLAQTTQFPVIARDTAGTYNTSSPTLTAVSVAGFVPSTAATIRIAGTSSLGGNLSGSLIVAPSTGWGGTNKGPRGSAGQIYPMWIGDAGVAAGGRQCEMILEGTTIAWACQDTGGGIACQGWDDNL